MRAFVGGVGRALGRPVERRQVGPKARASPRALLEARLRLGRIRLGVRGAGRRAQAPRELGREDLEQVRLDEQLHGALGGASAQQPIELLGDAGLGALRDLRPVLHHAPVRLGLDGQIAAGRELHGAQDADRILAKANVGIADGAHHARFQVDHAAHVVDDLAGLRVVEEAVDREVTTARILLGRTEDVVAPDEQVAALRLGAVAFFLFELARVRAERRGLDDLRAVEDVGEPEAAPDDPAVPEQALDLVRRRARDDVEVFGFETEEEITHATTDEVGEVIIVSQSLDDLCGVGIDLIRRNLHVELSLYSVRGKVPSGSSSDFPRLPGAEGLFS